MKTIKLLTLLTLFISFSSCSSDDDNGPEPQQIETRSITNLSAPQEGGIDPNTGQPLPVSGDFAKFDFSTGTITTSETDWDIAFRATSIIINGGASFGTTDEPTRSGNAAVYIANGTMESISLVEGSEFEQDSEEGYAITTGSGNGWYSYAGPPTHLITPIPGKILVIKTRDGRYAKIEILSYYKDAPQNPDAFMDEDSTFTFNYVYNPNEGEVSFQ